MAESMDALFSQEAMEVESPFPVEAMETAEIDLDMAIDPTKLAAQEQSLLLAKGTYIWEGTPTISVGHRDNDKSVDDYHPTRGRLVFRVSGIIQMLDDPTKRGAFTLYLSPDTRLYNGEPDGNVKSWARFTGFYFKQREEAVKSFRQLLDFIADAHYSMYIGLSSKPSNYLSQVKEL